MTRSTFGIIIRLVLYQILGASCEISQLNSLRSNVHPQVLQFLGQFTSCIIEIVTHNLSITRYSDEVEHLMPLVGTQGTLYLHSMVSITTKKRKAIQFPLMSHYSQCRVLLFPSEMSDVTPEGMVGLAFVPVAIHYVNIVPTFTLILLNSATRQQPALLNVLQRFLRTFVQSPLVLLASDLKETKRRFSILCIHCVHLSGVRLLHAITSNTDPTTIIKTHQKLHGNLHGGMIDLEGIYRTETCVGFKQQAEACHCAVDAVVRALNATVEYNLFQPEKLRIQPGVLGQVMGSIYTQYAQALIQANAVGIRTYSWLTAGETIRKYTSVTVIDTSSPGMTVLAEAFDLKTWLVIIGFSVFATFGIVYLMSETSKSGWKSDMNSAAAFVLVILIDQWHNVGGRTGRTWKLGLVTFACSRVAMLINGAYQGHLFSSLASVPMPLVPTDMYSLAQSDTFIISTSTLISNGSIIVSLLHSQMNEFLMLNNSTHQSGLAKSVQRLNTKLRFSNSTLEDIIHTQLERRQLSVTVHNGALEILKMPRDHVYFGEEVDVQIYKMLLSSATKSRRQLFINGQELTFFQQRGPLVVMNNFFVPIFTHKISRIYESGLWGLWESRYYALVLISKLQEDGSVRNFTQNFSHKSQVLKLVMMDFRAPVEVDKLEPLSLRFTSVTFQVLSLWLLGAMIRFFYEIVMCKGQFK